MTRISKQGRRRNLSPRKQRIPSKKTGSKRDNLTFGYRIHENALLESSNRFIPKIS